MRDAAGPGFAPELVSRGLAAGDIDNDGDVDLLITNNGAAANLLLNEAGSAGNAIVVRAIGEKSNRSAIGARLTLTVGQRRQLREVQSGSSYLGQNDLRAHFGLGQAARADRLEITVAERRHRDRRESGGESCLHGARGQRGRQPRPVCPLIMQRSRVTTLVLLLIALPSGAAPQRRRRRRRSSTRCCRSTDRWPAPTATKARGSPATSRRWPRRSPVGTPRFADAERELRAQLRGADPQTALQAHTVLASMYLDRGRFEDARARARRGSPGSIRRAPSFTASRVSPFAPSAEPREAADCLPRGVAARSGRSAERLSPARPRIRSDDSVRGRTRARGARSPFERALVRGERERAAAPFLSLRPIDDEAAGAIAFAPAAYAPAFALLLNGQLEAGLTALRQAASNDSLVADPALRSEPAVRGIAALRQGQVGQALGQLEAALTLAPKSAQARRILGTAYWVSGDVTQSLEQLRDAVRLDPRDERAWLALSRVLDDLGEWTEAADVLRKAVAALPESGELRWQLSTISGKRQRTDEADLELMAVADRLVVIAGTGDLNGRIASLAQAHLDYDRAVALLDSACDADPQQRERAPGARPRIRRSGARRRGLRRARGRAVARSVQCRDADGDRTAAPRRRPVRGGGRDADARRGARAGRDAPTADDTRSARRSCARDARPRAAPVSRRLNGLRTRAVELQRRLRTAGMLALEAELHRTNGEHDRAIEAWQQVLALEGRSAAAHMRLADVLVAAKRMDEAAAQLVMAIGANGGAEAHRRLALVYAAMGRADESARERRLYTEERLRELRER